MAGIFGGDKKVDYGETKLSVEEVASLKKPDDKIYRPPEKQYVTMFDGDQKIVKPAEKKSLSEMYPEYNQLIIDEGTSKNDAGFHISYKDADGLSGGYGHFMTAEEKKMFPEGTEIPPDLVETWLSEDLAEANSLLEKLIKEKGLEGAPPEAKNILFNMIYNMGLGKESDKTGVMGFSQMIKALQKEDYNEAANQMIDSDWYGQVGDRSKRLVTRMRALQKRPANTLMAGTISGDVDG